MTSFLIFILCAPLCLMACNEVRLLTHADRDALRNADVRFCENCLDSKPGAIEVRFVEDDLTVCGVRWDQGMCFHAGKTLWCALGRLLYQGSSLNTREHRCPELELGLKNLSRSWSMPRYAVTPLYGSSTLTNNQAMRLLPENEEVVWHVGYSRDIYSSLKPGAVSVGPESFPYAVHFVPKKTWKPVCSDFKQKAQELECFFADWSVRVDQRFESLSSRIDQLSSKLEEHLKRGRKEQDLCSLDVGTEGETSLLKNDLRHVQSAREQRRGYWRSDWRKICCFC